MQQRHYYIFKMGNVFPPELHNSNEILLQSIRVWQIIGVHERYFRSPLELFPKNYTPQKRMQYALNGVMMMMMAMSLISLVLVVEPLQQQQQTVAACFFSCEKDCYVQQQSRMAEGWYFREKSFASIVKSMVGRIFRFFFRRHRMSKCYFTKSNDRFKTLFNFERPILGSEWQR